MNKHDFAYSVGLIRVLETLLLNSNGVERMMFAKNAKESFQILDELDYSNNKAEIQDVQKFQTIIHEGLLEIKEILDKVSPDKEILNILWYKYDFHNIKTLVKAKFGEKSLEKVENLLSDLGGIPRKALIEFILEEKHCTSFKVNEENEKTIKQGILNTYKLFQKIKNPQIIDINLDKYLIKTINNIAEKSKNEFLINYIKKFIDIYNIKLFCRIKSSNKERKDFELGFIKNGSIPIQKFKTAFKASLTDFAETMKNTSYGKILEIGIKQYEEEKSFLFLEKEAENYLTNTIKSAKLIPFGPEPLIAYFLAKENNALIIRMILIHKMNQIDPEEIRERLRDLYS